MKIVDRLVVKLIEDGAIEEEDREIYEYGFHNGIIMLVNIVLTVLIGVCMKMFVESILFMISYIPIRTYAGGIHAKTQLRCFIYSNLLVVVILACANILSSNLLVLVVLGVIAAGIIICLAPVEDQNKPLDDEEVRVYGKKARRILLGDIVLAIVFGLVSFEHGTATVIVSVFTLSICLVLGYVKNYFIKRKAGEVH